MPEPPRSTDASNRIETETQRVDGVLAEGLRHLEGGDSTAWRELLRQHPDRATELERHAHRLQAHGFYLGAGIGRRLGPFELFEQLGQGGMGIVYRARADGSERDCAVKVVRPELLEGAMARRRFRREVEAAMALSHPGIVRILAVGLDDELPWFAMERIDGTSLATLIHSAQAGDLTAARRLSPTTGEAMATGSAAWFAFVLRGLIQVLEALQHAHERGVTHRDLKPSNILFDANGQAVLIDFGLAHTESGTTLTATGDTLGSLPYMAPELLQSGSAASIAADVYAIGASLYHALALQLPFAGANREGIRHGILHVEPRALCSLDPSLPADVEPVWRCAMAPEPRRRYASADAFAADLRRLLQGEPPRARLPGLLLRLRRWTGRHPAKALASATAALFLGVLPTALFWVQAQELRRTQRLSDLQQVAELAERDDQLWPARPETVRGADGMAAWLAQVDDLLARRQRHHDDLRVVRARGTCLSHDQTLAASDTARQLQREIDSLRRSMLDATTGQRGGWQDWLAELQEHEDPFVRRLTEVEGYSFAEPADARLHRYLANLCLGLDDLQQRRRSIEARCTRTFAWQHTSLEQAAESWRTTLAAIADRARNPAYRGLVLQPQFGLVPLGQDPASGWFEFAHLPSGEPPTRDAAGRLPLHACDGIVLVLLPGGIVRVGADLDPSGPHYDPGAAVDDTPSVEVRLDPFFVGKFEVTQAQWVRQRGHNNNLLKPGERPTVTSAVVTDLHPVDAVAYNDATRILRQWGLRLPTGAQWEYAARGGTTTRLWTGGDATSLDGMENLYDEGTHTTVWRSNNDHGHLQPADDWPLHAPIGRFAGNPFGLFDVLGNVSEWTLDAVRPYTQPLRDRDGSTSNLDVGSLRGGHFNTAAQDCSVSTRRSTLHDVRAAGMRAVRVLEGPWTQDPSR